MDRRDMRKAFKRRPSSAMVVAVLALVAAVVGTAVAGPLVTKSVLNKKEKKQTRTIARSTVKKLAPGLSVASAANASNSAKVDGADVCSGTVNVPDGSPQTLCSSGPLIVRGRCDVAASTTTGAITLDTSQDGGWYVSQNISDGGTFQAVEDNLTVGGSEELLATDATLSPTSAEVESVSVTMGHPDAAGSSINGQFSVQVNQTGTLLGTCLFSVGAIAG
jgi:hypothetical protein